MCGPATYARRLEAQGMVRLSTDSELWRRGHPKPIPSTEVHNEIETQLRQRLLELVAAGRDVVLDFSFWSGGMRNEYRRLLAPTGVIPGTVYVVTDRETALARVRARRGTHPDDVVLPPEVAARYIDHFEPPTADEGPLTVVDGEGPPPDTPR